VLVSLWSLKGGVGCSVTAALLALNRARTEPGGVVLVDICRDQPLVLGCPAPDTPGVVDWLSLAKSVPDGLGRLAVEVSPGLGLIWRGHGQLPSEADLDGFVGQLGAHPGLVLVDAGCVLGSSPRAELARRLAAQATRSILVTRACYLALSRTVEAPVTPSGVLVVRDPQRALAAADIEAAVGAPVIAEITVDPSISRAVDAGLLVSRAPRGLDRALEAVA
jgi:hypothetical protein